MKKLSLFLSAMLISLMSFAGTVTFDATVDKTEVTNATEGTLTKDGVSLHTSMGVLGNGKEYRIYKNQWMDISCEYGNITAVEFTCTKEGTTQYGPGCLEYSGTAGTYTYEGFVGTWTGNEEKVTLYGALNQVRATKIVVTYESSDANFVSQPMITGDVNFADTANVVITADEGMKIYYTLDGTDPTTASTEYTSPFEVYATTTVKAIAYNEATATSSLVTTTVFTQATKIPCAEAAAIALTVSANNALTDLVYNVKGYVTKIASDYNSPVVGKQLFWIADTKTGGEVLYSYNNNVPCEMEVGMKVRIVGKLTKWNTGQYIQPQIVNAEITVLAPAPKIYTVSASAENGTVEGAGQYEEGAQATLTATAAEGYEFVNWTVDGTEVSTENPYTFNVTADVALVANFKEAAAVTTKEEKTTCVPGTLADGKVTHDLPCCVIVQEQGESTTALKSVSPWEVPAKSIMTITPKEGVTILQYVINTKTTTLGTYLGKSELTNATKTATNNGLVTFTVTNGTEPVVMKFVSVTNKFHEITFTYTVAGAAEPVKYTVTVKAENGTVEGAGEYEEGAEATLTATANEGYEFTCWTVGVDTVSTKNPYKFNVTADVEVVANFKEAAPVTETVYFINAKKWAKVNVYAWTTDPNASWPGAAATKEAEQIAGYDVYSFTANAGQYANVIFNDGSSQTSDLVWTAGKYYVIDMGWLTKEEAEAELAAPLPETWNIVGDAGLMGKGWDLNAAENAMTLQADGTYLLEKKGITIVAGSYEYKAAKDHGWTVAVPQDGNQTLKITTSGIYDVTFVLDVTAKKLTATATLKQAAVVIPTIVIAGDMNSWNQTKDKFTMSADSLTATFKTTLAVKNYGFKMIVGGAWHSDGKTVTRDANSTKFTGANSNTNSTLKADIAGEYLFTWEYATKTLTITYPALPVKYNVTVTAENGTVTGAGEYEEGKTATLTATPAEGYEFVNWTVGDSIVSTENPYSFVVTADIALVANFEKIPATKYNVTVTAENGTVEGAGEYEEGAEATLTATAAEGYNFVNWTVADSIVSTENPYSFVVTADVALVANFKAVEPEIWTVAGAPASIFGTEWDPANTANNMTLQADGTYKWEKTDLTLAASHIQFKIAKNNKWDEAYPTDNYDLAINEAGIYTITIIFNATSKEVTATATKTGDAVVIPTIAIAGDMNGWNTTANEFVISADELTATLTLNLEAKEYGFKMIVAGNWTSDGAKVTRENNSIVFTGANGENSTLVADVAGEYTFTWTYATSTLVVTYPVASSLENAIVAEQPVKIVRNGQVFILKGDKMFNTMGQQVK